MRIDSSPWMRALRALAPRPGPAGRVVARIRGGLGNQLFCYAAARRLAIVNDAELVLDDVTGFVRDTDYRRRCALHHFRIPARSATTAERLEPFERYRRGVLKLVSRRLPYARRLYLEQEGLDFDERLLHLRVREVLYLDGLWQSEGYFKDVEHTIREDLRPVTPADAASRRMADLVRASEGVAVHVRWFDPPGSASANNLPADYYWRALAHVRQHVASPHFYLFSDDPEAARRMLTLPDGQVTLVAHHQEDDNGFADLWLMTHCRHFITANSTFSWWGAWLGETPGSIVVAPSCRTYGKSAWGFRGLVPPGWLQL